MSFSDAALIKLDDKDPVDMAISSLITQGLVETSYDLQTEEIVIKLTEKGSQYLNEEEVDEYIDGDEFQTFLYKAEKILDKVAKGM